MSKTTCHTTDLISSPCPYLDRAPAFDGNQRGAQCGMCETKVVNLSAYTDKAAKSLLESEEVTCITYLAGVDGAPIHRQRLAQRIGRLASAAAVALGALIQTGCDAAADTDISKDSVDHTAEIKETSKTKSIQRRMGGKRARPKQQKRQRSQPASEGGPAK